MAKTLLLGSYDSGSGIVQNSALTRYATLHAGRIVESGTETSAQTTMKVAGTLSRLWFRIAVNSLNGDTTVTSRKNTAAGNMSVSFATTITGDVADTTNSDTIAADDEIGIRIVTTGSSGSITWTSCAALFAATTNTVVRYSTAASQTLSRNTIYYKGLGGAGQAQTTESQTQTEFATAGTLKNLWVNVNTYTISGTSDLAVRKNGADSGSPSAMGVSFSGTGIYEDTTNTVSVANNDLINFRLTTAVGSGSQSMQANRVAIDFETTDGKYELLAQNSAGQDNSITAWYFVSGNLVANTSSETPQRAEIGHAATITRLWVRTTSGGTGRELALRKNAVDTELICLLTGSGDFEDTGTVTATATDEFTLEKSGGTGSIRSVAVSITNTESGGQTGRITAADAIATYSEKTGRITASDSVLTYSQKTGRITAADAVATYSEKTSRITAADAVATYSEKTARITAVDSVITWSPATGKITAVDAVLTYSQKLGRLTAADAILTYSEKVARATAVDAVITWQPASGRVTAVDAALTYSEKTGRITASDSILTYSEKLGRITAADSIITWSPAFARIFACDVVITYTVGEIVTPSPILRRGRERFFTQPEVIPAESKPAQGAKPSRRTWPKWR